MKVILLFLALSMAVFGQDLVVSPVSAAPGHEVEIEISLHSPPGRAPVALQWEVIFPSQLLDVEDGGPKIEGTARNSGKTVSCAPHSANSYICILFGGENPTANGSIATICFKIRRGARSGTTVVRFQQVHAVDGDSQPFALKDAKGIVAVH
jgi:hypothetical protein